MYLNESYRNNVQFSQCPDQPFRTSNRSKCMIIARHTVNVFCPGQSIYKAPLAFLSKKVFLLNSTQQVKDYKMLRGTFGNFFMKPMLKIQAICAIQSFILCYSTSSPADKKYGSTLPTN